MQPQQDQEKQSRFVGAERLRDGELQSRRKRRENEAEEEHAVHERHEVLHEGISLP